MRLRTTHRVTIYGEEVVGSDELGVALTESSDPIVSADARFRPQGEGLTREQRSDRIDSTPEVVVMPVGRDPETGAQVDLVDVLQPGQRCDVSRVDQRFTINRIDPHYGRRMVRRVSLELGAVTDG